MEVALLGPEGTYTHQAADQYFSDYGYTPTFYSTITDIFDSDIETAIIAFENSLGGGVEGMIDLLRERYITITGEQILEIDHCLLSRESDFEAIERVRSHPQALTQCKSLIQEHGWETVEASSTAKAASEVGANEAALASPLAGTVHGLNVLGEGVQDTKSNATRFLILNGPMDEENDKTSLILDPPEDRPGQLHSILGSFSGHEINLSYIQSRPTKRELGDYYFYIEAEIDQESEAFGKARQCLETYTAVDVLGSYPSANHP
ncbi:prephenate dehydratase [Haladaptatus salinisoli]|uniref:prephenate dehydratase n=1 Tax=Haladaptatus salinisoli TaxID=2884876 RepID=UPI001D0B4FA4|nr:prephenate dehydratase [Haladaptatus salinisoli]